MKISLPDSVTRAFHKQLLHTRKQSPHILFAGGIVGVVTSTVLACRATLKAGPALDDFKAEIESVKADSKNPRHDLAYVYMRDTAKLAKLYAPALVVGGASIAALTGSHVTMTRRNSALTATVVTLSEAMTAYRDRVRSELGTEKELDIYRGVVIEKTTTDSGEDVMRRIMGDGPKSPYARVFDESNVHWKHNSEYNRIFLLYQQNYFNHLLQSRGHVFLNEVYSALGMEHSREGSVVGWTSSSTGDHYVDFGIYDDTRFVNGWEPSVWLDFNVDGVIFDKI